MVVGLGGIAAVQEAGKSHPEEQSEMFLLQFDPVKNLLRFNGGWCEIPEWRLALECDRRLLDMQDARVEILSRDPFRATLRFPSEEILWELAATWDSDAGSLMIRTWVRNDSKRAVELGKIFLIQTEQLKGFSARGDETVSLPIASTQQVIQVQKLGSAASQAEVLCQVYNQTRARAIQAGFVTFHKAKTGLEYGYGNSKSRPLQMNAWTDFAGWKLTPEASVQTEDFMLLVGEDPHEQLELWAERARSSCSPAPRNWESQPIGWLGWSWVDGFNVERYEEVVLRNAAAIRNRLAGFGVEYIWVSIANLENGQPGNWLEWNYKNFPSGPGYFRERLAQMGFKWGLWVAPFMFSELAADANGELKDALLKEPDGEKILVYRDQWPYGLDDPSSTPPKCYALDPSHPKAAAFLKEVFETYRQWGVRYYMVDFLWAGAGSLSPVQARHHDEAVISGPELLRKGLKVVREACGDDTYLLASTGPTIHTAGFMDAVRTGYDFGEGRPLVPSFDTYPATYVINSPDYWQGPINAVSNQAATYFTHRKLYINDSGNVLTVDKPLQLSEAQVFATIHAMSGGPTMLGDDITFLDEERLGLIKQTLPRSKRVAFPVDLFSERQQPYPRVFHRRVSKPWGRFDVVVVYNLEPEGFVTEKVDLGALGLKPGGSYLAWEFWGTEYLGRITDRLTALVPPRSVKVYRLTEETGQPVLLGTDMHVLMGEMEIDQCEWNARKEVLRGRAIRPPGEQGSIFVHAPPGYTLVNRKGRLVAKDGRDKSLIIRCPLEFPDGTADWNLQFAQL